MEITEQLQEIIDGWLEHNGYKDIHAYGIKEVLPTEDVETRLRFLEGEEGYDEEYLYEHLYYKHLRNFTN